MHPTKQQTLLAAGDIAGLLAYNQSLYGATQNMARGYSASGDVVQSTADGRDFNALFNEFQAAAQLANDQQERFLDLFTFKTTDPVVSVLQTLGSGSGFEPMSEYGVPTSHRADPRWIDMATPLKWWDRRWGTTWLYLADATAAELEANVNLVIADDNALVFNSVMRTVFNNVNSTYNDRATAASYTVAAFANGDGWTPPEYASQSFAGSHTHYRVSGAAAITSGDLDEIVADFKSHGYAQENGSRIVIFVNPLEAEVVSTFRVAGGAKADFIASTTAPGFYTPAPLVGAQPPGTFAGFPVKGSYDEAFIIESTRIPAGYVVGLVSGGSLVPSAPISFREHRKPELRGLKLIKGNTPDYPLVDSYWARGFGTSVRHRLAGMVMQIKASGNYEVPALYAA